jgi:hypothetical protein
MLPWRDEPLNLGAPALQVSRLNQTSAASGVAHAGTFCATTLSNWTEVGPNSWHAAVGCVTPHRRDLQATLALREAMQRCWGRNKPSPGLTLGDCLTFNASLSKLLRVSPCKDQL